MSKVAIVGDTHFSPRTPVSRKDEYSSTLLSKLDNLLILCQKEQVSDCMFLGDLINANQMNMEYFIELYKHFLKFRNAGINLHTIVGNHDIPHGNYEFLDKSPIALLIHSGLFNNKDVVIERTYFRLLNYYDPFINRSDEFKHCYRVLLGHCFYLNGFGDTKHTLSPEQAKQLNFNCYFLGHDHTPYDPLNVNGYEVHRPGSFSRATSDTCQVNRDTIQVCIFDTVAHTTEYLDIPNVLPSKDIYKESKLLSKMNESSSEITLSEEIDELIDNLTFDFSSDIYKVVDEMEIPEDVRNKVIEYLESEGMFR